MDTYTIVVPPEDRTIVVLEEDFVIEVPAESRKIEVTRFPMTILASKAFTVGNTIKYTVDYSRWLANTATVKSCAVTSSSTTCTIGTPAPTVLGNDVVFFLTGGSLNEQLTVSLKMIDSVGNTKNDSISYTVVAP